MRNKYENDELERVLRENSLYHVEEDYEHDIRFQVYNCDNREEYLEYLEGVEPSQRQTWLDEWELIHSDDFDWNTGARKVRDYE